MQQPKQSKTQKFLAITLFFAGVSMFGFVIALTEGWTPFPSANASEAHELVSGVIPLDEPTNIDMDGEIAPAQTIELAEVIVVGEEPKALAKTPVSAPGAARRMPGRPERYNPGPSEGHKLVSPTGIASDEALSYQPGMHRAVRGVRLEARPSAFSHPRRNTKHERETFVFDAD